MASAALGRSQTERKAPPQRGGRKSRRGISSADAQLTPGAMAAPTETRLTINKHTLMSKRCRRRMQYFAL